MGEASWSLLYLIQAEYSSLAHTLTIVMSEQKMYTGVRSEFMGDS